MGSFQFLTLTFWVVVWVWVRIETLEKQGHSAGTGEHPKILGVSVHYPLGSFTKTLNLQLMYLDIYKLHFNASINIIENISQIYCVDMHI